ncbi:carboxypeptidase regulatory-like domain-containing protein [Jatrophihabitans sp.]|uniref:carboxypeptidase regulatory-like domain-containing protein n=1 Tax=Jatrophihabitans sp. TaxID=1932789 RepID=UPI0030C6A8BE|nr:S-layer domain protein [Jatrophihabitans sp.]
MARRLVRWGVAAVATASVIGFGIVPASADDTATASISGTVLVGSTDVPTAGVTAILVGDVDSGFFGVGPKEIASQAVGANGTYSFTGLAASDSNGYKVCFETGSSSSYEDQCWQDVAWDGFVAPSGPGFIEVPGTAISLTAGQARTGIDAHLVPWALITGKVTDAVTGKGLGNVHVDITAGNDTGPGPEVDTAADGTWTAEVLGGPNKNSACFNASDATGGSSAGYLNQCYNGVAWPDGAPQPTGTQFNAISGSPRSQINAALTPRVGTISGRVAAGDTGALLPGVTVTAFAPGAVKGAALTGKAVATTKSAGDGTYSLSLPAGDGVSYVVCFSTTLANEAKYGAQCYGYQAWSKRAAAADGTVALPGTSTPVAVAVGQKVTGINGLLNPGSISGRVTSAATRKAVAGVTVVLMGPTTGQYVLLTKTDASGAYSFGGLPQASSSYYVCFNSTGLDGKSELTQYNPQCWQNVAWAGHGPRGAGSVAVPVTSGATSKGISAALTAAASA